MNTEIKKLNDWLTSNKLTLNTKKSNCYFPTLPKENTKYSQNYIFDFDLNRNVNLEYKYSIMYSGVYIDENLSWKNHIDSVITKISKTIGMLSKLRHYIPYSALTNIYNTLITPYLSYGLISWGHACKSHLYK